MKDNRRYFAIPLVFVLLWSAFPSLFLYLRNAGELPFSDIAIALGASVFLGAACYGLMLLLTRNNALAGVLSFILMGLFLNFNYVVDLTDRFVPGARVRVYYLAAAGIGLVLIGAVLLVHRKAKGRIAGPVCAFGSIGLAAVLLINLITAVPGISRRLSATSFQAGGAAETGMELPNLYFLILDEYASFQELERYYDYSNEGFRDFLTGNGFRVSDSSYNRGGGTTQNMADTLWLGPVTDESMTEEQYQELLNNGKLYGILEGMGYDLAQLGSLYPLPTLLDRSDFLTRSGVATMNGETALEILVTNSMLRPLPTMLYWDRVGGSGEMLALEWLENPDHYAQKANRAIFLYVCCPHPPFYYDADGGEVPRSEWENFTDRKYYLDQLIYVTKKTEAAVSAIRRYDPDGIIILQSDHGLRYHEDTAKPHTFQIDDADQKRILNAVCFPGEQIAIEGLSGYNTWRAVLNLLGGDYPILPEEPAGGAS